MCKEPDELLSEFRKILTEVCLFSDFAIIAIGKPCQHI